MLLELNKTFKSPLYKKECDKISIAQVNSTKVNNL